MISGRGSIIGNANITLYTGPVISAPVPFPNSKFLLNAKTNAIIPSTDKTSTSTISSVGTMAVTSDATRGSVMYFDGNGSYINTNYGLPIVHTRCFWLNVSTNGFSGNNNVTVSTPTRLLWFNGGNYMYYNLNFGVLPNYGDTSNQVSTGTWYFYTFTYDGTTAKLYKNGVLDTSSTTSSSSTVDNVQIGTFANNAASSAVFHGYMDNVRCYDTALTQSQIQTIYDYETANPTSSYAI